MIELSCAIASTTEEPDAPSADQSTAVFAIFVACTGAHTLPRSHESALEIIEKYSVESKAESVKPARKWNIFRYL